MLRTIRVHFLLGSAILFTACGGSSKSKSASTMPPATGETSQNENMGAAPSATAQTPAQPSQDQNTTGQGTTSSSDQSGSVERQNVSGTSDQTQTTPSGSSTTGTSSDLNAPGAETKPDMTKGMSSTLEPAGIFAMLDAANKGEIALGKLAKKNAKNKAVKSFAAMMVTDHTKMQADGAKLAKKESITPASSGVAEVDKMQSDAQAAQDKLSGLKGAEFDKAYIDQMVQDHQAVLSALDEKIIPAAASDAKLNELVTGARAKVAAHLDKAQQLQAKLGGGTGDMNKTDSKTDTDKSMEPTNEKKPEKTNTTGGTGDLP